MQDNDKLQQDLEDAKWEKKKLDQLLGLLQSSNEKMTSLDLAAWGFTPKSLKEILNYISQNASIKEIIVNISRQDFIHLQNSLIQMLNQNKSITKMEIQLNNEEILEDFANCFASANNQTLKVLHIQNPDISPRVPITDQGWSALNKLLLHSKIETLNLQFLEISFSAMEKLTNLLNTLCSITDCTIKDDNLASLTNVIKKMRALKDIAVDQHTATETMNALMQGIEENYSLEIFRWYFVKESVSALVKMLDKNFNLKDLSLIFNTHECKDPSNIEVVNSILKSLENNHSISSLELDHIYIGQNSFNAFTNLLKNNKALTILDVTANNIDGSKNKRISLPTEISKAFVQAIENNLHLLSTDIVEIMQIDDQNTRDSITEYLARNNGFKKFDKKIKDFFSFDKKLTQVYSDFEKFVPEILNLPLIQNIIAYHLLFSHAESPFTDEEQNYQLYLILLKNIVAEDKEILEKLLERRSAYWKQLKTGQQELKSEQSLEQQIGCDHIIDLETWFEILKAALHYDDNDVVREYVKNYSFLLRGSSEVELPSFDELLKLPAVAKAVQKHFNSNNNNLKIALYEDLIINYQDYPGKNLNKINLVELYNNFNQLKQMLLEALHEYLQQEILRDLLFDFVYGSKEYCMNVKSLSESDSNKRVAVLLEYNNIKAAFTKVDRANDFAEIKKSILVKLTQDLNKLLYGSIEENISYEELDKLFSRIQETNIFKTACAARLSELAKQLSTFLLGEGLDTLVTFKNWYKRLNSLPKFEAIINARKEELKENLQCIEDQGKNLLNYTILAKDSSINLQKICARLELAYAYDKALENILTFLYEYLKKLLNSKSNKLDSVFKKISETHALFDIREKAKHHLQNLFQDFVLKTIDCDSTQLRFIFLCSDNDDMFDELLVQAKEQLRKCLLSIAQNSAHQDLIEVEETFRRLGISREFIAIAQEILSTNSITEKNKLAVRIALLKNNNALQAKDYSGTNLSFTNLSNTDLTDTKLLGADLNGSDLTGVKLTKLDIRGADLTEAKLDYNQCGAYLILHNLKLIDESTILAEGKNQQAKQLVDFIIPNMTDNIELNNLSKSLKQKSYSELAFLNKKSFGRFSTDTETKIFIMQLIEQQIEKNEKSMRFYEALKIGKP